MRLLPPKTGAELEEAKRSLLAFLAPLGGEETRRALVACGAQSVSLPRPPCRARPAARAARVFPECGVHSAQPRNLANFVTTYLVRFRTLGFRKRFSATVNDASAVSATELVLILSFAKLHDTSADRGLFGSSGIFVVVVVAIFRSVREYAGVGRCCVGVDVTLELMLALKLMLMLMFAGI